MLAAAYSYSQTCHSTVYNYSGPTTSQELADVLANSSNPVIRDLDQNIKNSLNRYTVFYNGLPEGLSDADEYIQTLNESNAEEVLSAIFQCQVTKCTYDTKPAVTDISWDDFWEQWNGNPISIAISYCTNCLMGPWECCHLNGPGCWDEATMVLPSTELYNVIK